MKYMIASDIHGSKYYADLMREAFFSEKADRLILLGDLLYHGPRNDLPKDYEPKAVIEILNSLKDRIIAVRGNCDAEVDQMVLDFPIMADYIILNLDDETVFATHGHIYNEQNLPPMGNCNILLCGHTHIPKFVRHGGYTYINPGSVSIPKEGSLRGYMIYEDKKFIRKDLDGNIINL